MAWYDIFTGGNSGLDKANASIGNLAGYSTGIGERGTTGALNYDLGLLSGDPTKVAQTLSPEIQQAQQQAQMNKNTVAQFGNRGGGMNAVMAGLDDATRAKLLSLAGGLRQGAAADAGRLGTTNLGLASNDAAEQAKIAQQQHENMMNGIFGKALSGGLGFLENKGLGAFTKWLGGSGNQTPAPDAQTPYSPVTGVWNTQL